MIHSHISQTRCITIRFPKSAHESHVEISFRLRLVKILISGRILKIQKVNHTHCRLSIAIAIASLLASYKLVHTLRGSSCSKLKFVLVFNMLLTMTVEMRLITLLLIAHSFNTVSIFCIIVLNYNYLRIHSYRYSHVLQLAISYA